MNNPYYGANLFYALIMVWSVGVTVLYYSVKHILKKVVKFLLKK